MVDLAWVVHGYLLHNTYSIYYNNKIVNISCKCVLRPIKIVLGIIYHIRYKSLV